MPSTEVVRKNAGVLYNQGVTAPEGQCPCARPQVPVWISDSFERLTPPIPQREQGLPSLKPKDRLPSSRVIFRVASLTKGPRVVLETSVKRL